MGHRPSQAEAIAAAADRIVAGWPLLDDARKAELAYALAPAMVQPAKQPRRTRRAA